jgi:hypothetical protein
MAACCALEPAPSRVPLSYSVLLPASLVPLLLADSLAAPHAASAREPASAIATGMARLLVLCVNSMPLDMGPGRRCRAHWTDVEDGREPKWPLQGRSVNAG